VNPFFGNTIANPEINVTAELRVRKTGVMKPLGSRPPHGSRDRTD